MAKVDLTVDPGKDIKSKKGVVDKEYVKQTGTETTVANITESTKTQAKTPAKTPANKKDEAVKPIESEKPGAPADTSVPSVQEVFGKFAAEIDGKVTLFDTFQEAKEAFCTYSKTAEFDNRAKAYLTARELDLESKMAKGRFNVIKDFLSFEASL